MATMCKTLSSLEKALVRDEGLELKPYTDTVGKLTIGVGRNLDDNGITEDEAIYMLRGDIQRSRQELSKFHWWRNLDTERRDVLVNMHFNLGLPRLLTFKNMIAALEFGDYKTAADEMLDSKWADQVGERAVRLAKIMRGDL